MIGINGDSNAVGGAQMSLQLRAIFAVSFVLVLAVALVAQAVGRQWRPWFRGAKGHKTLIGDVKAAVYSFMPYLV